MRTGLTRHMYVTSRGLARRLSALGSACVLIVAYAQHGWCWETCFNFRPNSCMVVAFTVCQIYELLKHIFQNHAIRGCCHSIKWKWCYLSTWGFLNAKWCMIDTRILNEAEQRHSHLSPKSKSCIDLIRQMWLPLVIWFRIFDVCITK